MRDTVHNVLFHMKYRPDGFVACDIAAHETGKLWHSHPTTTLCYILVRSMDVDMEIRRQSSKFFAQLRTTGTKQEFKTIVYKSMYCVVEREITLSTRHEPSFFFFFSSTKSWLLWCTELDWTSYISLVVTSLFGREFTALVPEYTRKNSQCVYFPALHSKSQSLQLTETAQQMAMPKQVWIKIKKRSTVDIQKVKRNACIAYRHKWLRFLD